MSTVKDLCRRLGIRHPFEQSTCIGYGQRKPTCGCAVAESSRSSAVAMLQDMSEGLYFSAEVSNEALLGIASLLLCKRWHQFQAAEKVQGWRRNLREITAVRPRAPVLAASSAVTPVRTITAPQAASTPRPSLQSFSDQQLVDEIKRRLQHTHSADFLCEVVQAATTAIERHNIARAPRGGDESISNPQPNPPETADTAPPSQASTVAQSNQANISRQSQDRPAPANTQSPIARTIPTTETVRQARLAALVPAVTSARPEPPARAPSPLRESHVECVVCTLSYEEDPDEHWECQSCLNRVHMHCFETWRTSQLPGLVTCIHCRTRVREGVAI